MPQRTPYAFQSSEGWTHHFGINLTVKANEIALESGVAVLEYTTQKGEEPPETD